MTRAALVEYQNLLLRSEAFDNASWVKTQSTVTADAVAGPFTGTFGDALNDNTNNSAHYITQSSAQSAGLPVAFSFWAKAAAHSWILPAFDAAGSGSVYFNLAGDGAIGTVAGGLTPFIEAVGAAGWYQCTIIHPGTSAIASVDILCATADGSASFAGAGVASVYLFGAQVVRANWPGPYVVTAAAAVNTGPIRSYSYTKQNLLLRSEDFSHATWTKADLTCTANDVGAPNGQTTADKLTETAFVATFGQAYQAVAPVTPSPYTFSCFLKFGTRRWVVLYQALVSGFALAYFDTQNGVVGSKSANATSQMVATNVNGWYRCSVTYAADPTNLPIFGQVILQDADNGGVLAAYNGAVDKYTYVWGAQIVRSNQWGEYVATTGAQYNSAFGIRQTP